MLLKYKQKIEIMDLINNELVLTRVKSRTAEKQQKILMLLGLSLIIIPIIRLIFADNPTFSGIGQLIDFIMFPIFGVICIYYSQRIKKNQKGQFIEWDESTINYKLKGNRKNTTVTYEEISSIKISIENIKLQLNDNTELLLDISDFKKYEDRILIKSNFEKIKETFANKAMIRQPWHPQHIEGFELP